MQISVIVCHMIIAATAARQELQLRAARSACLPRRRSGSNHVMARHLSQRPNYRILNGVLADVGQFPYLVGVYWGRFPDWEVKCTATIISSSWILTGSHCFLNDTTGRFYKGLTTVHAGSLDISTYEQFRISKKIVTHRLLDVGLVKVDIPFVFDENVMYIRLSHTLYPYGLKNCIGIGYGATGASESGWCNFLPFWIRYKEIFNCSQVQRKRDSQYHVCVTSKHSGQQTYYGDSGGPLVCGGVQVGVLTGLFRRDDRVINKYITIAHYLRWIQLHATDLPDTVSVDDDSVVHENHPHTSYSDLTWWLG